jgi:flagellar biosynthesis/type III secretory pathway M-ring protein FliF/YscJ
MSKSKKIFLLVAAIFLIIVIVVVIDMANKTTFPGQSPKDSPENIEDTTERREFDQY